MSGAPHPVDGPFWNAAHRHAEWDDFFVHNPASRHRRRLLHGLLARHGVRFSSVLDVGCGDGRLLEEMHRFYGCEIHGIEPGPSSAPERLAGRLASFHALDVQEQGLDRTFDLVISTEVLEHLPRVEQAVERIAAMCRGYFVATVPGGPIRQTDRFMGHVRHYTPQELRALLEGAGFETVECFAWGWPFHTLYRSLLDVFPDAAMKGFGTPEYGPVQKAVCAVLHALFWTNSRAHGAQIFYLGRRRV